MASERRLSLVAENRRPVKRAPDAGQMSLPTGPARRAMRHGPRAAVLTLDPQAVKDRLTEGWPCLMLRKFGSDQDCADFFGRTRQAASYWRSGHCRPDAPALALAWLAWADECAAMCGGR